MKPPKITKAEAEELTARHAKEPWKVFGFEVQGPSHETVARCEPGGGSLSVELVGANARRIVATINACAGMADPEAEIARLRQDKAELLGIAKQVVRYCQQWQSANGSFPSGDGRTLILKNAKVAINKTTKE